MRAMAEDRKTERIRQKPCRTTEDVGRKICPLCLKNRLVLQFQITLTNVINIFGTKNRLKKSAVFLRVTCELALKSGHTIDSE